MKLLIKILIVLLMVKNINSLKQKCYNINNLNFILNEFNLLDSTNDSKFLYNQIYYVNNSNYELYLIKDKIENNICYNNYYINHLIDTNFKICNYFIYNNNYTFFYKKNFSNLNNNIWFYFSNFF